MFSKILFVFALAWNGTSLACESGATGRLDIQTIDAKVFPYPHGLRACEIRQYGTAEGNVTSRKLPQQ